MKALSQRTAFARRLAITGAALVGTALTPLPAFAQNGTWQGATANFNTGANWNPAGVPTSLARFTGSGSLTVAVTANSSIEEILFLSNNQQYQFINAASLTVNGIGAFGIVNDGNALQTVTNNGTMTFNNGAAVIGGFGSGIFFENRSNAGSTPTLVFNNNSAIGANVTLLSAGASVSAVGTNQVGANASVAFNDSSRADNITMTFQAGVGGAQAGVVSGQGTGGSHLTTFGGTSHADGATITNEGGAAIAMTNLNPAGFAVASGGIANLIFNDTSHADGAQITNRGGGASTSAVLQDAFATGGSAFIILNTGSHIDGATVTNVVLAASGTGGTGDPGAPGSGIEGGLAVALSGNAGIAFNGSSHADNSTFGNLGNAVQVAGGNGGTGGTGIGGAGGAATSTSNGVASIAFNGTSHANGATFNNTNGSVTATAGSGGVGGTTGAGGAGGGANGTGGGTLLVFNNGTGTTGATINNTAGNATATGGNGGAGGAGAAGGNGAGATAIGGSASVFFAGTTSAGTGTTITNLAGNGTSTGGNGGAGGSAAGGNGGVAGASSATGGDAIVTFQDNASAGNATINNTAGRAIGVIGNGGNGNVGNGGQGGAANAIGGDAIINFNGNATAANATITNLRAVNPVTLTPGTSGTAGGGGGNGGSAGNSGSAQSGDAIVNFSNNATAGNATISSNGDILFINNATGGSAKITNQLGGFIRFSDTSVFGTAAGALITMQGGQVQFRDSASLGTGSINNIGGTLTFGNTSTAGAGSITNTAGGFFRFQDSATSGSATINNAGNFGYLNNATAGTSVITNSGTLAFANASDAVAARVINTATGIVTLDVGGFRLGSLSGTGSVILNQTAQIGYLDLNETFAGVISGVGGLVKRGTGTFVLTGTNTYSGNTVVEAGTLQLGNGGTTGSVVGNITDNSALIFNRSDNVTYGGVISGTGTLTKAGAGTLVLTNTNTYAGGTTIGAGTLQLGNGGATGSVAGNIANNAALVVNRSDFFALSGVISGTGTLTQAGTGTLALTGANTYTGLTTVSSGTLRVGNGATQGSIVSDVLNNGTFEFNRSNTYLYAGTISGTGAVRSLSIGTIILTGTNTYTGGTFQNSGGIIQIGNGGTTGSIVGNVSITSVNGVLAFNRSDTITFGGVISGVGGIAQNGAGTLILTGANTASGAVSVNSGVLQLTGSVAGATSVLANARITGTGTINGNLLAAGTVSPGTAATPFGTLTVTGTATFNAGSFLLPTINTAGQSSLVAAGTLTINGGTVRPTAVAGGLFMLQTDYRIAGATTARNGTFTSLDASLLPTFLTASLNYVGNDVFLRVRRTSTAFGQATGLTPNQAAVGGSLDAALAANNPLVFTTYLNTYNTLLPLSGAQLQGALNVLSGDALTAFPVAAQEHANRFGERLNAYTWSNSSNLWGLIAYGDQDADGDGNGPGFKANGVEFQLGFNTSLGHDTRLGLSVGMNNGDVTVGDRLTTGNVDTWSIGAQLRHDFGQIYASGQVTYSWHSIDSSRPLLLPGTATADYDAHTWTAGGELGWVIRSGQLSIEPHVSVRHASTSTDAYSESGPVGALDVAAADYETTRLGIGLRLANRDPAAPVRFHLLARYEHETGDDTSALDNALPGLPTFRVVGTELGDNILSGEIGAEFRLSNGLSLFATGGGHTRSNETSLQANAGLRVVF